MRYHDNLPFSILDISNMEEAENNGIPESHYRNITLHILILMMTSMAMGQNRAGSICLPIKKCGSVILSKEEEIDSGYLALIFV